MQQNHKIKKRDLFMWVRNNPIFRFDNMVTLAKGRIPGQVIIQFTDRCNAKCPQCGMRVTEKFERSKMNTDDIKRVIDAAAAGGVKSLSFTGGETCLYYDELISLISYAGDAGIEYIRTGTNGFMFMNWDKHDFAKRITTIAELAEYFLSNTFEDDPDVAGKQKLPKLNVYHDLF